MTSVVMVFGTVACSKDNPEVPGGEGKPISVTDLLKENDLASIVEWTYALDAVTDNALFYVKEAAVYSRQYVPVYVKAKKKLRALKDACPLPAEVVLCYNRDTHSNQDPSLVSVDIIKTDDGELAACVSNFKWNTNYTFRVNLQGETLTGVIATIDRNRDIIEIELPEYTVKLNDTKSGYNKSSDTYTGANTDFSEMLFNAFVARKIINCDPSNPDFDNVAAFVAKEGSLKSATREGDSSQLLFGDDFANAQFTSSSKLKEVWEGDKCLVRHVSTYCGQLVRLKLPVSVDLPEYDFLHLKYYTFSAKSEHDPLVIKYNFDGNDGSVEWWTQVNPLYGTGLSDTYGSELSNRYALKKYDINYLNLAEVAFNVVDKDDKILENSEIEAANLSVRFEYTDKTLESSPLPSLDVTSKFATYKDLWVDKTIFYFRTNEKTFIPVRGVLEIVSGDAVFEIPTRFDRPKNSVNYPDIQLDYSSFAIVGYNPFKPLEPKGSTIVLDENKIYQEPVLQTLDIKDNRPNGVSFDVMKDGKWVTGNVSASEAKSATPPSGGNGFMQGTLSYNAYGINLATAFTFDVSIPNDLKKLIYIKTIGKDPYIVVDYTSEVQFHGKIAIGVAVKLQNPWVDTTAEYDIIIKGID